MNRSCATFTAGARSGVWTVSTEGTGAATVVYSVGVGDNLAWDIAMVEKFGCTLHAFDPTPASIAWVNQQQLPAKLFFHPVGVAGHDGTVSLTLADSGSGMNFRPVAHSREGRCASFAAAVRRIPTLEKEHGPIDVLKLDIEGGEYDVIDDLLASGIRPAQLLVEFHHHFHGIGLDRTVHAVESLRRAGYAVFHMSARGLEMSFLHEGGTRS